MSKHENKPGGKTSGADALEAELMDYLDAHPKAADTQEGIAQWWLVAASSLGDPPEALSQALANLVAAGKLSRVESPDGRVIYANRAQPTH